MTTQPTPEQTSDWQHKKVDIACFTKAARIKRSEQVKAKLIAKGWTFIEFHDGGLRQSFVLFKRPARATTRPGSFFKKVALYSGMGFAGLVFLGTVLNLLSPPVTVPVKPMQAKSATSPENEPGSKIHVQTIPEIPDGWFKRVGSMSTAVLDLPGVQEFDVRPELEKKKVYLALRVDHSTPAVLAKEYGDSLLRFVIGDLKSADLETAAHLGKKVTNAEYSYQIYVFAGDASEPVLVGSKLAFSSGDIIW